MGDFTISRVLALGAMLMIGAGGALDGQPAQCGPRVAATGVVSSGASSTVLSTLASRGGQLVVLVLWRGAPGWLARGGRASTQGR